MNSKELINLQHNICHKYGAQFIEAPDSLKVGVSRNLQSGLIPIHGLRHPPEGDTTGWYIWVGELSQDSDFFVPLCAAHLDKWCPAVLPYLGLAPGWRFLLADEYKDICWDEDLLNI